MKSAIETKMDALEHELVALVCDSPAENAKLLEDATAGKIGPLPTEGNGVDHAKVLLTTLRWLRREAAPKRRMGRPRKGAATAETPKRKPGRPKGSKNKPAAKVVAKPKRKPGRPKGSKAAAKAEAPKGKKAAAKRPGRPKGSKNKPKTEPAPPKKAMSPRKRKGAGPKAPKAKKAKAK
jgi:hypothetical protein